MVAHIHRQLEVMLEMQEKKRNMNRLMQDKMILRTLISLNPKTLN